jgi:CRISPR/Cas system-associated endoribonuclease Cas2
VSEIDNHFFAVYSTRDIEIEDAAHFLKIGFENNEPTLVILSDDRTKKEIIEKLHRKYNISYNEINNLQSKGDLYIAKSSEYYLPNNTRDISYNCSGEDSEDGIQTKYVLDKAKIRTSLVSFVNNAMNNRKIGARVFISTSQFFRLGLTKAFLDYEIMPPTVSRDIPLTVVNAYQASDVSLNTDRKEIISRSLLKSQPRISNKYNDMIENPPNKGHIAVLYVTEDYRDSLIASYINEGLKRRQLCVYASIHSRNEEHLRKIQSRIINFDDNTKNDNLLIINLSSYYVAALTKDLNPFDKLIEDLVQRTNERHDKHVRIVADCAPFLYQNKHFDEAVELEKWWHQRPIEGSYFCPYRNSTVDKFPYDYHRYRMFANHDAIIDEHAEIIGSFSRIPHNKINGNKDRLGTVA